MAYETGRADVGRGVELAFDRFGDARTGRPLVLVMGIGAQRMMWPDEMCARFVAAGFCVVRFDHRDIGQSTRLDALGVPDPRKALARRLAGRRVDAPYTLSDMATDVAGLVTHLGWRAAHVVGASLGGMIAQHLAIEHPARVRTLTSIMSTVGARRYLPEPKAFRALFAKPPRDAEGAGRHLEAMFAAIGSPLYAHDGARLRAAGALSFERGMSPRGFLRHFAAALASGDRRPRLPGVRAPALVIHGTRDPMFPLAAGRTLTELVPHGTWLPVAGMGHDMPEALWPMFVAAIARHATRADAN